MTFNKFGNIAKHTALSVGLVLAATSFAHAGTVSKKTSEPTVDPIAQVIMSDSLKQKANNLFDNQTSTFDVKEPVQQMMVAAIDFMGSPNPQLSKLGSYLNTVDVGQFSNSATYLVRDTVIALEKNNPGSFINFAREAKKDNAVVSASKTFSDKAFSDLSTKNPEYKTLVLNYLNSVKAEISSTTNNKAQLEQVNSYLASAQPSVQNQVQNTANDVKNFTLGGISSITSKLKQMQQPSEQNNIKVQENFDAGTQKVSETTNNVKNFTLGGISSITAKIQQIQQDTEAQRAKMGLGNEARPLYGPNVK